MIRALIVALLVGVVAGCGPTASPPTASPVVVASPTPTVTSAPTTAPPSPTASRYVNPVLGYAVTLPPPWRISECLSLADTGDPVFLGDDALTWRTAADEQDVGESGGTGVTGAGAWVILIAVQASSQTGPDYASSHYGGSAARPSR